MALDLERYDWKPGAAPLVRPTEGTVPERLPPRMEIRRNAPLETPHILVLINDEADTLLPALAERSRDPARHGALYDTELMLDSGRVRGWKLDETDEEYIAAELEGLARLAALKYGTGEAAGASPFLFAVGDGNHSLATAKAVWEEYKAVHSGETDLMNHNARWALVEIENLYDPALRFEPIHRIVFGAGAEAVLRLLEELPGYHCRRLGSAAGTDAANQNHQNQWKELAALVQDESGGGLRLGIAAGTECFLVEAGPVPLAVDAVEPLLERLAAARPETSIDYIHGTEELLRLASLTGPAAPAENTAGAPRTGILLPPFRKQGLFETVARRGPLPRKSFSMGEAREKRFYLECRSLFG